VAIKKKLEPFLPTPVLLTKADGMLGFNYDRPQSVGRVRAFYGNFGMFVRALAYIQANGPDGLRQTTEDAVLNANYIRKGLEGVFDLPYSTPTMHEVVFSDKIQAKKGVRTMDIAKRLIDYGFHPYTTAFPLIVPGALMIEPTESESKAELDRFCDAMISIREEIRAIEEGRADKLDNVLKGAPHTAETVISDNWARKYSRELAAFPAPWLKDYKFWPAVGRVDNPYGDRNLVCACPPIETYHAS
jgi:glycine cleavage system protein P-like pyridoxal-binding family